jgi:hypothetical protein
MFTRRVATTTVLLVVLGTTSAFAQPRHLIWSGTITTNAGTGMFTATTHYHIIPEAGTFAYSGRFRGQGAGCVARRGGVGFVPTFTGPPEAEAYDIVIQYHRGSRVYRCFNVDQIPQPPPSVPTVNVFVSCVRIFPFTHRRPVPTGVVALSGQPSGN